MPLKNLIKRRKYQKKYNREVWYPKNRKKHIERVSKRRKEIRVEVAKILNDIKQKRGCIDCRIKDFRVLDFDHKLGSNKKFAVGDGRMKFLPIKKILEEVKKCDVRCANCHRIKTWERINNAG